MGITFQRERFTSALAEESLPLGQMHNKEIGGALADMRVRVPKEMYEGLDEKNLLRVYTLREDGVLKGYNVFAIMPHPEYGDLMAQHDVMFLHPSVRSGFNAVKFMRWCDDQLKAGGIVAVTQHVTAALDFSKLLMRMGYQHHETIYIKRLN